MDKYLRPDRFATDPSDSDAAKQWQHWKCTFVNFLAELGEDTQTTDAKKLKLLINYVAPSVYEHIAECKSYSDAMDALQDLYIKPKNVFFARHVLASRRQNPGESLDKFLQALKLLAKDCEFKAVSADEYRDDYIRDAFINGLISPQICQRLLESRSLDLPTAYEKAHTLEMAEKHAVSFNQPESVATVSAAVPESADSVSGTVTEAPHLAAAVGGYRGAKCFFCGFDRHPRRRCPARNATCGNCGKKGHYAKVCQSPTEKPTSAAMPMLASVSAASPGCLEKAVCDIRINRSNARALVDTGSSESFVSSELVQKHK